MDQACPHQPFDSQEVTSPFWATGSSQPNEGLGHHKLHIYPPLSTDILYYKPETSANTIDLWGLLASPSVYLFAKKNKNKKNNPNSPNLHFLTGNSGGFYSDFVGVK